jgi:oligopeptide/dipeptide ABC transporter ATP-binding protein
VAALLDVEGLSTELPTVAASTAGQSGGRSGRVRVVDGVSLRVPAGRAVGLVGESGSGKSMTALSILGLLPRGGRITGGAVRLDGEDLVSAGEARLQAVRGDRVAMVFQEPMTALNPVYTIGDQVGEPLRIHRGASRREARARAVALLADVGIADPERRAAEYPHQLSGGMRQRAMIAMALACRPSLLIADEPTTALDVTIQAQVLELIGRLRREREMALLLITHDLAVVAETCDEVVVMYAGQVVEQAPAARLFAAPRHPYTAGLLRAAPSLASTVERLREIPGMVPRLDALPAGCRFQDRCPRVQPRCRAEAPTLDPMGSVERGHLARCFFPVEDPAS